MPMLLVPSYNTKTIVGTWVRQGGAEMRPGSYKVTVPARVTNATDDVIIPKGLYSSGILNTTVGLPSLNIEVPCTNDPDNFPHGWQLQIEIIFTDAPVEKYTIPVDIDGPDEINLRTVEMVEFFPPPAPVLIRDIPGGLATLDEDGVLKESQRPPGTGGGASTVEELTDAGEAGKTVVQAETAEEIIDLLGAAPNTAATVTEAGLVELATDAETAAGTDTSRAVTPAGLASVLPGAASATASGTVELATTTEATTGTDTVRAVTPAGLAAAITAAAPSAATATSSGLVELATTAEATAGTDTSRAVTPAGVAAVIAALVAAAPGTLDTLNELAEALGDDPNFATTIAGVVAGKAPLTVTRPVIKATAPNTWPLKSSYGLVGFTGDWEYDHTEFGPINDAALPADSTDTDLITDVWPAP